MAPCGRCRIATPSRTRSGPTSRFTSRDLPGCPETSWDSSTRERTGPVYRSASRPSWATERRTSSRSRASKSQERWTCGTRRRPSRAYVVGLAEITLELWPSFVVGDTVLWGRSDFFRAFVVAFDERGQHFTLHPALPTALANRTSGAITGRAGSTNPIPAESRATPERGAGSLPAGGQASSAASDSSTIATSGCARSFCVTVMIRPLTRSRCGKRFSTVARSMRRPSVIRKSSSKITTMTAS